MLPKVAITHLNNFSLCSMIIEGERLPVFPVAP